MSITPVTLRNLVNAPATPGFPATAYTLHSQDLNAIRDAIGIGVEAIYTKGLKLGADGIQIQTTTPFLMDDGSFLRFLDGGNDDAVVGSLTHVGELSMQQFTVMTGLTFQADSWISFQGSHDIFLAEQEQTNLVVQRGDADVLDLDVFFDSEVSALSLLYGTYVANKVGEGFAMRNATTVSRVRVRDDGVLVIEDVVDTADRPWAYANLREIPTGVPGSTPIQEIVGVDGVAADQVSASPRTYQIGLTEGGVEVQYIALGPGPAELNVDAMWAAGAGAGSVATLLTVAERNAAMQAIADLIGMSVEIAGKVSSLRMPDGTIVTAGPSGFVQFVNSSSAVWDSPAEHMVRVVTAGGGGGGGAVDSITAGLGLGNVGTPFDPILDVKLGAGLEFLGDTVVPDFGTGTNEVARGDHLHAGVYSPVGHLHTGTYVPAGGAYADLAAAAKIGSGAAQVAAGNDTRFHTQGTDVGSTSSTFTLRSGFGGTPANGDIVGLVIKRGLLTDARLYFNETTDKWVAGLVGSEVALILEGDSRLADARTPVSHDIDSAHSGQLPGSRIAPSYSPANYTPAGATLEGDLEGIDDALGAMTMFPGLGQSFHGAVHTGDIAPGQYLIGSASGGLPVKGDGTLGAYALNTTAPVGSGLITVKVWNLTQVTSAIAGPLNTGETFKSGSLGLAVANGDVIAVSILLVSGVPGDGTLNFTIIKE